jgi:membrane-associated phospholipid phosphatase
MLTRRIWPYRAEIAFWSLWLAAICAFVALAAWVDRRYTLPLDRRVTFGVQELYRYAWADRLFESVNTLAGEGTITLVLFLAFMFTLLRGLRYEALMVAGTGAVRFVQLGVRSLVHRPDAEFLALRANFDGLHQPEFYPNASGFPSGHVFGATIVYGLIFAYAPRALAFKPFAWLLRAFCVFEIALIGPARMYVGAHWFSDVVGAALLAAIYLALAWKLDGMISHIRALAAERDLAADAGLSSAQGGRPRSIRAMRADGTTPAETTEPATR